MAAGGHLLLWAIRILAFVFFALVVMSPCVETLRDIWTTPWWWENRKLKPFYYWLLLVLLPLVTVMAVLMLADLLL